MLKKISTIVLLSVMLLTMPLSVLAQSIGETPPTYNSPEEKFEGAVFGEVVTAKQSPTGNTLNIPGGTGYPWGQPGLQWTHARMEGVARTGITDVSVSLYLRGRLTALKRDGVSVSFMGSGFIDGWYYGTTYIDGIGYVFGWVYGHTWRAETNHSVTDFSWYDWHTSLAVQTTL